MKVTAVVGGQFGSEAKGAVTAALTRELVKKNQKTLVVRVAGPNAGHTAYDQQGKAWALRTVPVGLVVDSDKVYGHIAAGSEVELAVLWDELDALRDGGHDVKLTIDPRVTVLTDEHKQIEASADLTGKVGSTGKGIGACRAARIMRTAKTIRQLLSEDTDFDRKTELANMVCFEEYNTYDHVVVEGTQGYGLSLYGDHYPKCTSSDTTAKTFLALAGISAWDPRIEKVSVIVCARTYPIRVAGNSGELKGETTWEDLGLTPELTTVTQKVRRVGHWDQQLVNRALVDNGAAPEMLELNGYDRTYPGNVYLALTMLDQVWPDIEGATNDTILPGDELKLKYQAFQFSSYSPLYMGTGPNSYVWNTKQLRKVL